MSKKKRLLNSILSGFTFGVLVSNILIVLPVILACAQRFKTATSIATLGLVTASVLYGVYRYKKDGIL